MRLRVKTSPEWLATVLADFDSFLRNHAACERKAGGTAMSFVAHYPDRPELVRACIALAREELEHFERVVERLAERGLTLGPDTRDPYVGSLKREFRKGSEEYFLDRLLVAAIVEARGCERFALVGSGLDTGPLRDFYRDLAASEARHHELFLRLARIYFTGDAVEARLAELLEREAAIMSDLPLRAAVY